MSDLSSNPAPRQIGTFDGMRIVAMPDVGLASVLVRRGKRAELDGQMQNLFAVRLPDGAGRTTSPQLSLIGTGPAAFLAVREGAGIRFADDLGAKLAGLAAVSDQSSAYEVLRLSSPHVRSLLQKGAPIDLHPTSLGEGGAAVTMIAHIPCIFWESGEESFDIAVSRSMAAGFQRWLASAAKS